MAKFLWNAGPRINADMVALGRKPMFAQNFVNQIMTGAKLVEQTENCRVFTDAKGKYRLEVSLTENTVERIAKSSSVVEDENAEFHGQYTPSIHAMERFRERFADTAAHMTDDNVGAHLNNLLRVAVLHSTTPGKRNTAYNYDAVNQNIRIIVDKVEQRIITVHQIKKEEAAPIIEKDSPLFGAIIATAKRELAKARKSFRKTNRELTEQLASIQIELAHAMVNKTRAKGEHIVSAVERKMDELTAMQSEIVAKLDAENAKFERVKADAGTVIGGAK